MYQLNCFREIVLVDFEFHTNGVEGNIPDPVCLVAYEMRTGRTVRLWRDEFPKFAAPYSTAKDTLFVAYLASAEINCHLSLQWPVPERILDLYVEFRYLTNGVPTLLVREGKKKRGHSILDALFEYGLSNGIDAGEKDRMRQLILGGTYDATEKSAILQYCETDVVALKLLLPVMVPKIDLPRAIYRGRYMTAVARMEHAGVPIDLELRERLNSHWEGIQNKMVAKYNPAYQVYDGLHFSEERFSEYLLRKNISWPIHPSGRPILSNKAFQDAEALYPEIGELWQLRGILSKFRLNDIRVGTDGFNRCSIFPFAARTSRNLPSNKEYIFGVSSFLRSLIRPFQNFAICYLDWRAQEFGIAAKLSADPNMIEAYLSGDCYLGFAKLAKAVPPEATKTTHEQIRNLYKRCVLGINYGMEYQSLAVYIGQQPCIARDLLEKHRKIFRKYREWSENIVRWALIFQEQSTVFGWREKLLGDCGKKTDKTLDNELIVNPQSIRNFPMQANAAEILRLACCLGTERGLHIGGPIHDAVLLVAPVSEITEHVEAMRKCMMEASRVVLDGFELAVDGDPILYPNRFVDKRGVGMWNSTMEILEGLEREEALSAA